MDERDKNRDNKINENLGVIAIIAVATILLFAISQLIETGCLLKTKTFINNNNNITNNIQMDDKFSKMLIEFCEEKLDEKDGVTVSFNPSYDYSYISCTRTYVHEGTKYINSVPFYRKEYKEWQNNQ